VLISTRDTKIFKKFPFFAKVYGQYFEMRVQGPDIVFFRYSSSETSDISTFNKRDKGVAIEVYLNKENYAGSLAATTIYKSKQTIL